MRFLVTAGPTHEPIDPVRYLANRSSGKMGYALAEAARDAGHEVILVSGPVTLPPPRGIVTLHVRTALEMRAVVKKVARPVDAIIMSAAVADFRPAAIAEQKLKKSSMELEDGQWQLTLVRNPDILAGLRDDFPTALIMGFAAETENLRENALAKLREKRCDFIVMNDVSQVGVGFGSDQNEVTLFQVGKNPAGETYPRQTKTTLARVLVEKMEAAAKKRSAR